MTHALTTKQKSDTVRDLIVKYKQPMVDVLPDHIPIERAMRIFQTACTRIPKLLDCSQASLITSMVTASEFNLEPNTPLGQCYIIPYGKEATFQMGYQGMMELSFRTTVVESITAREVREKDVFEYSEGTETKLYHPIGFGDRGPVIGYYAVVKLKNGGNLVHTMSKDDCMAHGKKYSKSFAYASSGWQSNPDAMCKKTCIIQALKYAPKSIKDKEYEALLASCYSDTDIQLNGRPEPAHGTIDPSDLEPIEVKAGEIQPGGTAESAPKPDDWVEDETVGANIEL